MRHPTQKIENGMLLGLRVIGAQFIKVFKDFRDTTIQLSFFRREQGGVESGPMPLQVFA